MHINRDNIQIVQYVNKIIAAIIFCFATDMANLNEGPKVDIETMR